MKKIITEEMQQEFIEKLEGKSTNLVEILRQQGALKWINSQVENEQDQDLVDHQLNEMAERLQPAVDFFIQSLKTPGVAEKFYDSVMPHISNNVEQTKKKDDVE